MLFLSLPLSQRLAGDVMLEMPALLLIPVKVPETDSALRLNSLGQTPTMAFTNSGEETLLSVPGPEPCLPAAAEAPLRAVGRVLPPTKRMARARHWAYALARVTLRSDMASMSIDGTSDKGCRSSGSPVFRSWYRFQRRASPSTLSGGSRCFHYRFRINCGGRWIH